MVTARHLRELTRVSGNFWETYLDPASQAVFRRMRDTFSVSGIDSQLEALANSFDGRETVTGPRLIPFPAREVVTVGAPLNSFRRQGVGGQPVSQPAAEPFAPFEVTDGAGIGRPMVSAARSQQGIAYLTPLPANCVPLLLVGKRLLTAGIDFRVVGGFLETHEPPHLLFELEGIVVWREVELRRNPASYAFGVDALRLQAVSRYQRYDQTPDAFLRAGCEAAGLWEVTEDCVILARADSCYVTDQGRIPIRYDHTPLVPGTLLRKGEFIGAAPRFTNLNHPWFVSGFDLGQVAPYALRIPPGPVRVEAAGGALLPVLLGSPSEHENFHAMLRRVAATWQPAPATALEFVEGVTGEVDWLAEANANLAGSALWVVDLNCPGLDPRLELQMRQWLARERPLGRVVVFAGAPPVESVIPDFNGYLFYTIPLAETQGGGTAGAFELIPPGGTARRGGNGNGFAVYLPGGEPVNLAGYIQLMIAYSATYPGPPEADETPLGIGTIFLHHLFTLQQSR